jgi:hypothetical protein
LGADCASADARSSSAAGAQPTDTQALALARKRGRGALLSARRRGVGNTHEMRVEEREEVSVGRREQRQARLVHAYCSHGAVVALRSMRGSLSPTAAEATKRTRSPIAPGSVRLPGGG